MYCSELDTYEAIEAAVKETARGRAFLAEHALRARQSETMKVLAAIERLEQYWLSKQHLHGQDTRKINYAELPKVQTDSIAENATLYSAVRTPGERNQSHSDDESVLSDIARALEAP